jgi:hypothetical protein
MHADCESFAAAVQERIPGVTVQVWYNPGGLVDIGDGETYDVAPFYQVRAVKYIEKWNQKYVALSSTPSLDPDLIEWVSASLKGALDWAEEEGPEITG